MGADVQAGGGLVVAQSLGDQAGHGLLGVGQAVPPGDGPGGGGAPVAAADAELTQLLPDAGLVTVGTDLAVSAECVLQVADGLVLVAVSGVQDAEVFCRGGPGPRIGVLRGGFGQAGRVAARQAPAVGRGGGQGRDPGWVSARSWAARAARAASSPSPVASAVRASQAARAGSPSRSPGRAFRSAQTWRSGPRAAAGPLRASVNCAAARMVSGRA